MQPGERLDVNFYGDRGKLYAVLPYTDLREQARSLARRLMSLRLDRGARVAIVADTGPDFQRSFLPVSTPVSCLFRCRHHF